MFNVKVYKTVWNKSKVDVDDILYNDTGRLKELISTSYFYDVTLEFPPFIDLEIHSEQWNSGSIKRLSWSIDNKCFYCYADDEYSSFDFDEDFLKDMCLQKGWKLLEEP